MHRSILKINKKIIESTILVILIIVVGAASFYFVKSFQARRNQSLPIANFEERSVANLNDAENLATSSLESKIWLSERLNDYYYKDNSNVYFNDTSQS